MVTFIFENKTEVRMKNYFRSFVKMESAGGILLIIFAGIAIIIANTPFFPYYEKFFQTEFEIRFGALSLSKPLLLWINDGLMAVFFFLVGLELKREFIEGEFKDKKNILLPLFGALGGMVIPAVIYIGFNWNDSISMKGWAIPAATDIAFALGVLSLFGRRVPLSMKVFLTSLAIFDDIGAILIIAFFYSSKLSFISLGVAGLSALILLFFNWRGIFSKSPYILVGLIMWVAVLKSGIHATIAGVLLAFFIPISGMNEDGERTSPLKEMEHDLHNVVAFFVLPVFAFANSGLRLIDLGSEAIFHPVPVGIAAGLFIGKQVGVFSFVWLAVKTGLTALPKDMSWGGLYGLAILAGIGFTMSLFIGSLAFESFQAMITFDEKLGIIMGSLLSGVMGYLVLKNVLPGKKEERDEKS
jgi:NhaA family Na+:H+ antiporter